MVQVSSNWNDLDQAGGEERLSVAIDWQEFEFNGRTYCGASVEIQGPVIDLAPPVELPPYRSFEYVCGCTPGFVESRIAISCGLCGKPLAEQGG